jgi:hypothetical protein
MGWVGNMVPIPYHEQPQRRGCLEQHACPVLDNLHPGQYEGTEVRSRVDKWSLGLGIKVARDSTFARVGLEG